MGSKAKLNYSVMWKKGFSLRHEREVGSSWKYNTNTWVVDDKGRSFFNYLSVSSNVSLTLNVLLSPRLVERAYETHTNNKPERAYVMHNYTITYALNISIIELIFSRKLKVSEHQQSLPWSNKKSVITLIFRLYIRYRWNKYPDTFCIKTEKKLNSQNVKTFRQTVHFRRWIILQEE